MSVSGKSGTGGHVKSQFKYERYLNDDARMIDTADGGASKLHIDMGGYENFELQSVDITVGHERGGKPINESHEQLQHLPAGRNRAHRELLQTAELLQTMMAETMLRGMSSASKSPWESGRCIDLRGHQLSGETHGTQAKRQLRPGGQATRQVRWRTGRRHGDRDAHGRFEPAAFRRKGESRCEVRLCRAGREGEDRQHCVRSTQQARRWPGYAGVRYEDGGRRANGKDRAAHPSSARSAVSINRSS